MRIFICIISILLFIGCTTGEERKAKVENLGYKTVYQKRPTATDHANDIILGYKKDPMEIALFIFDFGDIEDVYVFKVEGEKNED